MRLIHTADWHLGKHIEGHSRLEEQELFLEDFEYRERKRCRCCSDCRRYL